MIDSREAFTRLAMEFIRFSGAASLFSPYFSGIGAILMLHRVSDCSESPLGVNGHLSITPAFLDATLSRMKKLGYIFVGMDEALDRVKSRNRERFATITADDGYRDNLVEALPVLEKHATPATIYIAPNLTIGVIDIWWEVLEQIVVASPTIQLDGVTLDCTTRSRKISAVRQIACHLTRAIPEQERQTVLRRLAAAAGVDTVAPGRCGLMDWDEIRRIAAHPLVAIGAHTMNHFFLRRLSDAEAGYEMEEANRVLRAELGVAPRHLAYPYGSAQAVGEREVGLAREIGYASAVTTRHGLLQPEHSGHLHALPRISVNGRFQKIGHVRTMLSGITAPLANSGRRVVTT
jgi:peptidoglycan/xylan/chitin deacetylase (PgdA/CDA1 family)